MALGKTITTPNGEELSYHKIVEMVVESETTGRVKVSSFLDASHRASCHAGPYWRWYPVEWTSNFDLLGEAYESLKTLPEFAGAEDA